MVGCVVAVSAISAFRSGRRSVFEGSMLRGAWWVKLAEVNPGRPEHWVHNSVIVLLIESDEEPLCLESRGRGISDVAGRYSIQAVGEEFLQGFNIGFRIHICDLHLKARTTAFEVPALPSRAF